MAERVCANCRFFFQRSIWYPNPVPEQFDHDSYFKMCRRRSPSTQWGGWPEVLGNDSCGEFWSKEP